MKDVEIDCVTPDCSLLIFFFIYIFSEVVVSRNILQITPYPNVNVRERSSVDLNCTYSGSSDFTLLRWVCNKNTQFGFLRSTCSPFGSPPDPALYQFYCPSDRKFILTVLNVTRVQHGNTWYCSINSADETQSPTTHIFVTG